MSDSPSGFRLEAELFLSLFIGFSLEKFLVTLEKALEPTATPRANGLTKLRPEKVLGESLGYIPGVSIKFNI